VEKSCRFDQLSEKENGLQLAVIPIGIKEITRGSVNTR
jgi:hypothetical protein